jgi:sulfatase modifying factor 1
MKQIYFLIAVLSVGILAGCGSTADRGEVVGVPQGPLRPRCRYGMVYVPSGSFLMGQTDQDVTFAQIAQTKQVTIPAFFMDQTEISNSQYRQFVNRVRDSIAIVNYLSDDPKYFITPKGAAAPAANAGGKRYINWNMCAKEILFAAARKGQRIKGKNYRPCFIRPTIVFLTVMNWMCV